MKSLIEKIFKREPTLNYVIAEYKPTSDFVTKAYAMLPEYGVEAQASNDEMEIDNLYQRN